MKILITVLYFICISYLSARIINIPTDQPTIQTGIYAATDGDTVLVQPGTYAENINFAGNLITVGSLFLTTQDTTFISQTVIDGNQNGSVVTFVNGENSTAVFCGFKITNGFGSSSSGGGGILCSFSSPTLKNLIICNSNAQAGGGIFFVDCLNASLLNVQINNNNSAGFMGSGIFCNRSNLNLENVTFESNFGGDVIWSSLSSLIMKNCLIINNVDYGYHGIALWTYSSLIMTNVTIANNSGTPTDGGIFCALDAFVSIVNCIMWGHSPEIEFCLEWDPNNLSVAYSNIMGGESGIVTNNNGTVNWLEGNIDENPLFIGYGDYSYTLLDDSPCVNNGIQDTIGLNLPALDLAGNPRIFGSRIDMGAYENQNVFVDTDNYSIPIVTKLNQNYPNPFNPTTTIQFSLQNDSEVKLAIYNIKGQKIKLLTSNKFIKGSHSIIWNGDDDKGNSVSSGIYLYKMNVDGKDEATNKCLLLK
jgi:hypothetical protein